MSYFGFALLIIVMVGLLAFFTFAVWRARITKTEFFLSNLFVLFLGMAGGGALQHNGISWLYWVMTAFILLFVIAFLTYRKFKHILGGVKR